MALSPSEIQAIAQAVVAQAAIGTAAGLVIGLVVGFILNLKVVGPRVADMAERRVTKAILDPEGAVQKARATELEGFKTALKTEIKIPEQWPDFSKVDALEVGFTKLREQFNLIVPLMNNLSEENLQKTVDTAIANHRRAATARGEPGPDGELTPAQQAELDNLRRDPEGKAALVGYEAAIDFAVGQKLLKPATGKALKKQLNAAFENGQPLESIIAPYRALLDRFSGVPSVSLAGGGSSGGNQARRIGT